MKPFGRTSAWTLTGLLLIGAAACDEGLADPLDYRSPRLQTVERAGDGFIQEDTARGQLWYLDAVDGHVDAERLALAGQYTDHYVAESGRVFVLTRDEPALQVIAPTAEGGLTVPLDTAYDAMQVSPDERFVVAYFRNHESVYRDEILFTPNRVAIIDIEAPAGERVIPTTLAEAPDSFVFAPPFTLGTAEVQRFAVALSDGTLSLIHLTTDDAVQRQRIIPLAEPGGSSSPYPRDLFFSDDDVDDPNDMTLFVLADGSREIFAIDLLPALEGSGHIIQPAINQITAGAQPASMVPFSLDGRDKLLVMDYGQQAVTLVDVDTRAGTSIPVPRSMQRALVWEQVVDGQVVPRGLFYSTESRFVYFVELDAFERHGDAAMRALELGGAIGSLERVEAGGAPKAVARYADGAGLDIIDLERRRTVSLPARVTLSSFAFSGDWLFAVSPDAYGMVGVDLLTDTPFEIALDEPATQVVVNGDTMLLRHDLREGWVSAINIPQFQDGVFADAYGYALEGVFDWNGEGQQ